MPAAVLAGTVESGAAARAAAVAETFVMEGTSGERGRIEPRGALSTQPARIRPGRPLPLTGAVSQRRSCAELLGARPPARRPDEAAPPCDPLVARGVREPQQQIAMARERRAEADEIAPSQLVERA
jgi:hypothetical protein